MGNLKIFAWAAKLTLKQGELVRGLLERRQCLVNQEEGVFEGPKICLRDNLVLSRRRGPGIMGADGVQQGVRMNSPLLERQPVQAGWPLAEPAPPERSL